MLRRSLVVVFAITFVGVAITWGIALLGSAPASPAVPAPAPRSAIEAMTGGIPPSPLALDTILSNEIPTADAFDGVHPSLSVEELRLLRGKATIINGQFHCGIINDSQCELSSVVVRVTAWRPDGKPESRIRRFTASRRAGGATVFEGATDLDVLPWQRWEWSIVEAR